LSKFFFGRFEKKSKFEQNSKYERVPKKRNTKF
jgi:hypothetical protein